jgi:serine/threonine-protein kinase
MGPIGRVGSRENPVHVLAVVTDSGKVARRRRSTSVVLPLLMPDESTIQPAGETGPVPPPGVSQGNGIKGGGDTASLRSSETFGVQKTDSEIGKAVLELGLVTNEELASARDALKDASADSDPNQRSLTDILVARQLLTKPQAERIRKRADQRRASQVPGYQLMGQLGKGAMATVYKARQTSLDRIVALKVLPERSSADPDFVDRFYKEGQAAARLSHNNIVQAIDVGETPDGRHYFVMEYLEGKTLYDIMQPPPVGQGRTFGEAEALDIGIQMADALAHAHQRGLIHRDVKPKNIILTPNGKAKLTDLGLARDVSDKAAAEGEAGKAFGTPYYISPEQIRGEVDVDHRADLYGLGATLYHLLVGRPPFEGESPTAVMHKHLRDDLVPPDHLNVALGTGISEVVEYSMGKQREERYQSADQMLEDLRLVAAGEPPRHARQAVDFGSLADMEQAARQSTIDVQPRPSVMERPEFIVMMAILAASIIGNLILVLVVLS